MNIKRILTAQIIIICLLISCAPKSTGDVFTKIQKVTAEAYAKLRPVKLKMDENSIKMDLDSYKIEEKKFNEIAQDTLEALLPLVKSKGIKLPFEQKKFKDSFTLSNLVVKEVFFDNIQGNFMLKFEFDCTVIKPSGITQLVDISFLDADGKLLIKQPFMIIKGKDKIEISVKIDERIAKLAKAEL